MPETVTNCPLCDSDHFKHFENTQFRGNDITNQICCHCGFVFQSPRMTESERDVFYTNEYRTLYQGEEGPNQKDIRIQESRASKLLNFIRGDVPEVEFHLDIGSSTGILLGVFNEHYHSQGVGVEPGDLYRKYAQSQGSKVYADIEEVKPEVGKGFDLISLVHVLEHIPDPAAYLANLREQFSSPGGFLLIEVPNLYVHDSFEIAHMTAFTEHSLVQTLIKSGYSVVAQMKHGNPRSHLLSLYLTVLAQKSPGMLTTSVVPDNFVRQKRKIGMIYRRVIQKLFPNKAWITF